MSKCISSVPLLLAYCLLFVSVDAGTGGCESDEKNSPECTTTPAPTTTPTPPTASTEPAIGFSRCSLKTSPIKIPALEVNTFCPEKKDAMGQCCGGLRCDLKTDDEEKRLCSEQRCACMLNATQGNEACTLLVRYRACNQDQLHLRTPLGRLWNALFGLIVQTPAAEVTGPLLEALNGVPVGEALETAIDTAGGSPAGDGVNTVFNVASAGAVPGAVGAGVETLIDVAGQTSVDDAAVGAVVDTLNGIRLADAVGTVNGALGGAGKRRRRRRVAKKFAPIRNGN